MRMKHKIFLLWLLVAAVLPATAQSVYEGRVVSPDGRPLEGVILSVPGTRVSALTDASGAFRLETDAVGTLRLMYADYYSREFRLAPASVPSEIVMVPTGETQYSGQVELPAGTQTRDRASALLSTVYRKDMKDSPSPDLAWQGTDPALTVVRKSGMPGEGGYFNVRGLHSLNAENLPLLVVNGVPFLANTQASASIDGYSRDALFGYNAHDIRSITVLKGAEAAMYGSLGSNGVVLIETEQANSDKLDTRISFQGNYGLSKVQQQIPLLGVDDYCDYLMAVGQTRYESLADLETDYPFLSGEDFYQSYLFNNQTDWNSLIYRDAFVTDNVFRVEGGDEIAKYNISFGYTREEGVLEGTQTNRYHTAMNSDIVVTPKLDIVTTVNLAYVNSDLNHTGMNSGTNAILAASEMMPNLHPYQKLSDGGVVEGRYLQYDGWNVSSLPAYAYDNVSNPLAIVNTAGGTDKIYDANIRLGLNWRPSDHWTVNGLVNIYYDYTEESIFTPGVTDRAILPQVYGTGQNHDAMGVVRQNSTFYNLSAAYANRFGGVHDLNAYAGLRLMSKSYEFDAASGYNSASDYYRTLSKMTDEFEIEGTNDDWKWLGLYAHADYVYDNLYKASAGFSLDGSSASGVDAPRFGFFPSASLTWLAANTGALPQAVDHLNVSLEASLSGNSRFSSNYGKNYYVSDNLFNMGTIVRHGIPNTALEWEKKAQADLGADLSLWQNALSLRLAGYYAYHYDLLLDSKISPVYGSSEAYYANTAAIGNLGAELSVRWQAVRTQDFAWTVFGNASWLRSRIADLGDLSESILDYTAFDGDDAQTRLAVGRTPYEFWGYETAGIYATTEEALQPVKDGEPLLNTYGNTYQGGDVIFVDQNHDGVINDKDRVALGSATPDLYGALGTSVRWQALTLTADFGFSLGNEAYNAYRRHTESMESFCNQSTAVLNRWQLEGQQAALPRAAYGDPSGNNFFSDRWVEDASYLKLRRLMLAYELPQALAKVLKGNVWVSAENLFTLSHYLGGDPEFCYSYSEALRGFDYAKVSNPITVKVGVNFNF